MHRLTLLLIDALKKKRKSLCVPIFLPRLVFFSEGDLLVKYSTLEDQQEDNMSGISWTNLMNCINCYSWKLVNSYAVLQVIAVTKIKSLMCLLKQFILHSCKQKHTSLHWNLLCIFTNWFKFGSELVIGLCSEVYVRPRHNFLCGCCRACVYWYGQRKLSD